MKKEGFNEFGEPTLHHMDDYGKKAPKEKREIIKWVIISGLIIGVFYAMARYYFWNAGEKELNIPQEQKIIHY